MPNVAKLLTHMRRTPGNVRFNDLVRVCVAYFGEPRQSGTSHMVFAMPWSGDPRVNIQNDHGQAKRYQVVQVLLAIERWEGERR
ncbi:toxin HicA [Leifsonia sp. ku-ls]|nr:toxin HicA [Leifsonia sp. ku-ls]